MVLAIIRRMAEKIKIRLLMRNEMESDSLRQHFRERHELDVGLYSYGCFDRFRFPPRTRIGRYCSMARTARVIDANHPVGALTTHPYLYESRWGVIAHDIIDPPWLIIEDDVWLGQNAVIMPGCKFIGRGAIIGAGAVVTRDVLAYGIVTGVPASLKRMRFPPHVIKALEDSRWWELSRAELTHLVRHHQSSFVNLAALGPDELAALLPVQTSDAGRRS